MIELLIMGIAMGHHNEFTVKLSDLLQSGNRYRVKCCIVYQGKTVITCSVSQHKEYE